MTTIVGLEHGGKVWLGADSQISSMDGIAQTSTNPKLFNMGDVMIVACAGSLRVAQVMQYMLELPFPTQSTKHDMAYMVTEFAEALRHLVHETGAGRQSDGMATIEFGALVGFRGKLYKLDADYNVHCAPYMACGAGEQVALGALYAATKLLDDPKAILDMSLRAAGTHNIYTGKSKFMIRAL